MENLLISYPKCTTCQKAKKWLQNHQIEFNERHIVEQKPTIEELKKWIPRSGKEIQKWFNTSGLKYKELKLKDKLPMLNEQEKMKVLASDGMLVKRPILITEKNVLIGFKENEWSSILEN